MKQPRPASALLALLLGLALASAQQGLPAEAAEAVQAPWAATAATAAGGAAAAALQLAAAEQALQQPSARTAPQAAARQQYDAEGALSDSSSSSSSRAGDVTASGAASQHSQEALAAAAQFMHPLAPAEHRRNRHEAEQSHADMQAFLQGFFASGSSTSRLTSTWLQRARAAAVAAGGAKGAQAGGLVLADTPRQEDAATDVLAAAGGLPCDAVCARAAAEQLLVTGEGPGQRLLQLRWPQLPEDPRRWAAWGGGHGCLPRQPGEALTKDHLLIAAVGNNLSAVEQ